MNPESNGFGPIRYLKAVREHSWAAPYDRLQALAFCSVLLLRADNSTGEVKDWCSSEQLAVETGIDRHRHRRLKAMLQEAGLLQVEMVSVERPKNGHKWRTFAHRYTLIMPNRSAESAVRKVQHGAESDQLHRGAESAPIVLLLEPTTTTKALSKLQKLTGWKDQPGDAAWLAELAGDFPDVDLAEEAKGYAAWVADDRAKHPHKALWNYRSGFRNRVRKAREFQQQSRASPGSSGRQRKADRSLVGIEGLR